jgi:hypothetical protein
MGYVFIALSTQMSVHGSPGQDHLMGQQVWDTVDKSFQFLTTLIPKVRKGRI